MLLPEQVHRLFQLALVEFAPDWEISGACTELSLHRAEHWASGLGTFGLVLHDRVTGATKVLGRRTGELPNATYPRGISYRVLEAYADRITDPIRRYFEEIGVVAPPEARFQKPPAGSGLKHARRVARAPTSPPPDCHAHDSSRAIASGQPPSRGIAASGRHRPTAPGPSLLT